ncbi:hypothetical protein LCGC14_0864780 [marine sediment metagenome]|uniref:ArsR family transcriptional regulator n=1 Tax=marine sediment metagenome TaxID=412755 RepID=A0A0F9RR12_9ZZZZ
MIKDEVDKLIIEELLTRPRQMTGELITSIAQDTPGIHGEFVGIRLARLQEDGLVTSVSAERGVVWEATSAGETTLRHTDFAEEEFVEEAF